MLVKVRHKDVDASAEDPASEVGRTLLPEDLAASHRDLDADFQWAVAVADRAEFATLFETARGLLEAN